MEIDLERPSCNEDMLDILDGDTINDTDGVHDEEEIIASPTSSKNAQENTESYVSKNNINIGGAADMNVMRVDGFDNGVPSDKPQNGLEFESKEAAYSFYREYARSVGFGITIKASRRSKTSGKFIDVKIVCSRFGNKSESGKAVNSRSCPKTGCKAGMHVKRKPDGNWFIYSIVKEHNHEICPDDFDCAVKGKNKEFGNVACKKKGLQLVLDEADVQILLEDLMHLQAENPGFWYSLDFDQEKMMRNVLWVDAKGRKDYKDFCDVIIMDTHYVRNKYHTPLVTIVGINHHFQPILLGCALIGDDTMATYLWLMRTWLKAVGGHTPGLILTDQDKALKETISEVFPDARHCFCLWHILGKIPENLSYVMKRFDRFTVEFKECISRAWTEEEFEKGWSKMVEKFELGEDEWVQSLYEDRKKWVPTYMRGIFLAGLCTAERSDSIVSSFDNHINRETTLKEFMEHYKFLMHKCYEEEARADIETLQKQPALRSHFPFEKQMSMVYTHAIFEKFQAEVLGILACNVEKVSQGERTVSFHVDEFEHHQNFIVTWNEAESTICCLCHAFEYRGFLCRHALIVLQTCGVPNIPYHYILKRWTRNAKTRQVTSGSLSGLHFRGQRFDEICRNVFISMEEGSLSQETYDVVFCALEDALKQCTEVNEYERSLLHPKMLTAQGISIRKERKQGSNISKTSRKKKKQKQLEVTEAGALTARLQDNSPQEQLKLTTHSFDIPYVPQQNIPVMEMDTGTPDLGGLCVAQQSRQGQEQLSSISPVQDGYYTGQHAMQGLVQMQSTVSHIGPYRPHQSLQELLQGQFSFTTLQAGFGIQDSLEDVDASLNR